MIIKNKKGFHRTIATLLALFLFALVFIIFFVLFRSKADKLENTPLTFDFSSVNTEYVLNTFLRSEVGDAGIRKPFEEVSKVTYADLISWTCSDPKESSNHRVLEKSPSSIYNYFSNLYDAEGKQGRNWGLKIVYSTETGASSWVFSNVAKYEFLTKAELTRFEDAVKDVSAASASFKWKNYGSQVIPCLNKGFAKVMLFVDDEGVQKEKLEEMLSIK